MTATSDTNVTTQVCRVYIRATPEAIWGAITKYGYGGHAQIDLRPGGATAGSRPVPGAASPVP